MLWDVAFCHDDCGVVVLWMTSAPLIRPIVEVSDLIGQKGRRGLDEAGEQGLKWERGAVGVNVGMSTTQPTKAKGSLAAFGSAALVRVRQSRD